MKNHKVSKKLNAQMADKCEPPQLYQIGGILHKQRQTSFGFSFRHKNGCRFTSQWTTKLTRWLRVRVHFQIAYVIRWRCIDNWGWNCIGDDLLLTLIILVVVITVFEAHCHGVAIIYTWCGIRTPLQSARSGYRRFVAFLLGVTNANLK